MESRLNEITTKEIAKIAEKLDIDALKVFNAIMSVIAEDY